MNIIAINERYYDLHEAIISQVLILSCGSASAFLKLLEEEMGDNFSIEDAKSIPFGVKLFASINACTRLNEVQENIFLAFPNI